jgi:hypothetical protein
MALVALWAAWPIYQSTYLFVTVGGAVLAASGIAVVGLLRSWSWFTITLVTVGAYLVLGLPLAVPSALASVPDALSGFVDLLSGTIFSWKELTTISLPVGSYQTLLIPVFIVFLVAVTAALSLAWRSATWSVLVVPIMFAAQVFGLAFGSSAVSEPINLFGLSFPSPRESIIGLAAFVLAIAYLVWRAQNSRNTALRRSTQVTGVRRAASDLSRKAKRAALAVLVMLVAVAVAVPLVSTVARPVQRDVLRTAIDRAVDLREYVSPLTQYRGFFTPEQYDTELFTVASDGELPSRLRLAVLSHYDGQVFRVIDPSVGAADQATAFERVPTQASISDNSESVTITIGDYDEVWLPVPNGLESIDFAGSRSQALTDAFFYNDANGAGVELDRVSSGDSYVVTSAPRADTVAITSLSKPATAEGLIDEALIPAKLSEWVRSQKVGEDGASLEKLVTALRARGYLSHSLTQPEVDGAGTTWASALEPYTFEPSLAGHSVDRIDSLFELLIDKEQNAGIEPDDTQLVAGVGDDEQFAVAGALIAQKLGYPSRVVLGFSLDEIEGGIPACDEGTCAGKNLTAWVEVQDASGSWVTMDTTPQYENPISPRDDNRRDPENDTDVIQEGVTEELPPNSAPTGGDAQEPDDNDTNEALAVLFAVLRIVGTSLLVLLLLSSPVLVILGAKLKRRRDRRRATDATAAIAGGWEEYVDAAVDHGLPRPGSRTRTEAALEYGNDASTLATLADEAVFGPVEPDAETSTRFWALVDAERSLLGKETSRWSRLRASLSLRSFAHLIGARSPEVKR